MIERTRLWILACVGVMGFCELDAQNLNNAGIAQVRQPAGVIQRTSKRAVVRQAKTIREALSAKRDGSRQPQKEPTGFWGWLRQLFGGQAKHEKSIAHKRMTQTVGPQKSGGFWAFICRLFSSEKKTVAKSTVRPGSAPRAASLVSDTPSANASAVVQSSLVTPVTATVSTVPAPAAPHQQVPEIRGARAPGGTAVVSRAPAPSKVEAPSANASVVVQSSLVAPVTATVFTAPAPSAPRQQPEIKGTLLDTSVMAWVKDYPELHTVVLPIATKGQEAQQTMQDYTDACDRRTRAQEEYNAAQDELEAARTKWHKVEEILNQRFAIPPETFLPLEQAYKEQEKILALKRDKKIAAAPGDASVKQAALEAYAKAFQKVRTAHYARCDAAERTYEATNPRETAKEAFDAAEAIVEEKGQALAASERAWFRLEREKELQEAQDHVTHINTFLNHAAIRSYVGALDEDDRKIFAKVIECRESAEGFAKCVQAFKASDVEVRQVAEIFLQINKLNHRATEAESRGDKNKEEWIEKIANVVGGELPLRHQKKQAVAQAIGAALHQSDFFKNHLGCKVLDVIAQPNWEETWGDTWDKTYKAMIDRPCRETVKKMEEVLETLIAVMELVPKMDAAFSLLHQGLLSPSDATLSQDVVEAIAAVKGAAAGVLNPESGAGMQNGAESFS